VCGFEPPRMNRALAEQVVQRVAAQAARIEVRVVPEIGTGDPADLILAAAEHHSADLVVVGNKGMGEATRFKLGSVPDRIAHGAPCDVLIVDTTRSRRPRSTRLYGSILAGTDGSPTAGEAARKAMELASTMRAHLALVFVGDPLVGAIRLEEAAKLAPQKVPVERLVVQGEPAEQLVRLAEEGEVELVVVGNKGMSGARRYFLGSVPNAVAHEVATDVLIVKTTERSLEDLALGTGGVVDVEGRELAVFRDDDGAYHALVPKCTHLGCMVGWNGTDRTWDCPCHGSRYAISGEVIRGPAAKALTPAEVSVRGRKRRGLRRG
jgi:nucleotide-binding universal stress UspA family protein/nitrite reductase/ring-hydroxylating ferredoxin subunit